MRIGRGKSMSLWAVALALLVAGCAGGAWNAVAPPAEPATMTHTTRLQPSWNDGVPSVIPASVARRVLKGQFSAGHPGTKGVGLPVRVYTCSYFNAPPYPAADGCELWSGSGYAVQSGIRATRYPVTSNPQGDVVTADGILLIADTGNSTIDSKSVKGGALTTCVSEPGQWPVFVDATEGATLIAISNINTTHGGAGSLAVAKGCGSAPAVLPNYNDDAVQGIGVAINGKGDCYWTYNDSTIGGGYVAKYTGCAGTGLKLPQYGLYAGTAMNAAGGIAFDGQDNMYLNDQTQGIWECTLSSNYDSCSEAVYTGIQGYEDNLGLNFSKDWKYLFWSDIDGNEICYTPTPVTNSQTCVKNSLGTAPFGVAPYKASSVD